MEAITLDKIIEFIRMSLENDERILVNIELNANLLTTMGDIFKIRWQSGFDSETSIWDIGPDWTPFASGVDVFYIPRAGDRRERAIQTLLNAREKSKTKGVIVTVGSFIEVGPNSEGIIHNVGTVEELRRVSDVTFHQDCKDVFTVIEPEITFTACHPNPSNN